MNVRALAAIVICEVMKGASLSDVLSKQIIKCTDTRDRALVQTICYGVCRWFFRLDAILKILLDKPLKTKDQDIYCLLLIGLYQLMDMRIPPHAILSETVSAAKNLKKSWAKNWVNAILRQYQRKAFEINQLIQKNVNSIYSHPAWMIELVKKEWLDDWENILIANNQHPPFSLRVNQKKLTRERYIEKLLGKEIEAYSIPETASGITLLKPCDVKTLPGFLEGEISVQDGAAQLAAQLLSLEPGNRVLDACAAPGGKTTHILELEPHIEKCIAIDHDPVRLQSILGNLTRLQLQAELICADAGNVESWWDGMLFDRILLDAPCSASGVIRRHPDIKLLRRAEDIDTFAKEQLRLLSALWPVLKKDGLLVYATCSIYAQENQRILSSFLASHPDVKEDKIKASWGQECIIGRQILPGMHGMDGFYFACLRK